MTIEPQTLALVLVFLMGQSALALLFLALGHPQERGVRHVGFAILIQGLGVVLALLLRKHLSAVLVPSLIYALLLGGTCYLLFAIRLFYGRQVRFWHPILAGALVLLALLWLLVLPETGLARLTLASLLLGLIAVVIAQEFFRKTRDEVWAGARWLCLGAFLAFGLTALSRSLLLYLAPASSALIEGLAASRYLLMGAMALYAFLGLGLALVLAQRLEARQQRFAQSDLVTGLSNRQGFEAYAERVLARARPLGQFTSLLLLEIDRFEEINRTCGRGTGDLVLEVLGDLLHQQLRERDGAGRFVAGELAVLLPETHHSFALPVAERVRRAVEALELTWGGRTLVVTASFGVASTAEVDSLTALFELTTTRLNRAKANGHNRVVAD